MTAVATIRAPEPAGLQPAQVMKTLMVLGLLQSGPKHGYELHRIVVAHGSLYSDFKKPTLYHLLHRLALQGSVRVNSVGGARGARGERLVFTLAPAGRTLFLRLLRGALGSYDGSHAGFEVAVAFLAALSPEESQVLLRRRRDLVRARRAEVEMERAHMEDQPGGSRILARQLAADHALGLMDAEIGWMDRAIRQVATAGARKAWAAPKRANSPGNATRSSALGKAVGA